MTKPTVSVLLQLLTDTVCSDKAVKEFEAAAKSENGIIAPIALKKAGIAYLSLDNKKAAKQAFQTIKDKYATSAEAQDIDKYIANIAD